MTAAGAEAGFTAVQAGKSNGEANHVAILDNLYGGSFAADATLGGSYTNGRVTARRSQDFPLSVGGGAALFSIAAPGAAAGDQQWVGGIVSARAVSRYAGYEQTFGLTDNAGTFHKLFDVSGTGMNVGGSAAGIDLAGQTWQWARRGGGDPYSSDPTLNNDGSDHMISYRVSGPAADGTATWLLFWEDAPAWDSDFDYNDLVVQVTGVMPLGDPAAIPLPPAVWTGLTVLLGGGLWSARHRIRRWLN
jgi:hypothetical protein